MQHLFSLVSSFVYVLQKNWARDLRGLSPTVMAMGYCNYFCKHLYVTMVPNFFFVLINSDHRFVFLFSIKE